MLSDSYAAMIRVARRRPALLAAAFLLPFILFSLQLPRLRIVTDLRSLIPFDDIARADSAIGDHFGLRERLLVVLQGQQEVFDVRTLRILDDLQNALEALPGVTRVRSILSEEDMRGDEWGVRIEPFVPAFDSAGIAAAARSVRDFPRLRGLLVGSDMKSASLLVEIEEASNKASIVEQVRLTAADLAIPADHAVLVSGMPVYEGVLGELILSDLLRMLPMVAIALVILLYAAFGSLLFAAVCLVETCFVVVVTLGLMASLGQPLFILQAILPVILMGIAVTDEVHIFARYFQEIEECPLASVEDGIDRTMQEVGKPIFLTSLTTALAFLTFLTSSMPALRSFGLFAALGVMVAMVFSLLITPTLISIFGVPRSPPDSGRWDFRFIQLVGRWVARHQRVAAVTSVVLIAVVGFGLTRVYIQDSWMANFDPDSRVRQDDAKITASFGGTMQLHVELDTGREGGVTSIDFIRGINSFQEEVDDAVGVGGSFSFVQPLFRLNQALTGSSGPPESSSAAAQMMEILGDSGYEDFWDFAQRKALVTVFVRDANYQDSFLTLAKVRQALRDHLPQVSYTFGGHYSLGIHWVDLVRVDLPKSLFFSFLAVLGCSALVLGSVVKGVTVTAPIALAVMMSFSGLGYLDEPIGVALSMFTVIVLGLGIDYAIHLHNALETATQEGRNEEAAVIRAFRTAGPPILWSAAAVVCSFIVLLTSGMPPIQELGLMVAIGVTSAALATFLFLPLFFIWGRRVWTNSSLMRIPLHAFHLIRRKMTTYFGAS